MNDTPRWPILIAVVLLTLGVGALAYNAGIAHGVAQGGTLAATSAGAAAAVPAPYAAAPYPPPYAYYGWHRPWGFGFVAFPLFFFAFWFLVVRGIFWRRRAYYGRGWGPWGGGFEEWHRREHERMSGTPRTPSPE